MQSLMRAHSCKQPALVQLWPPFWNCKVVAYESFDCINFVCATMLWFQLAKFFCSLTIITIFCEAIKIMAVRFFFFLFNDNIGFVPNLDSHLPSGFLTWLSFHVRCVQWLLCENSYFIIPVYSAYRWGNSFFHCSETDVNNVFV